MTVDPCSTIHIIAILTGFKYLKQRDYTPVFGVDSDDPTNISMCNPKGDMCYDNIWVTSGLMSSRHNGTHGVVRRGLKVGERGKNRRTVSDHCPVWVEFKVEILL